MEGVLGGTLQSLSQCKRDVRYGSFIESKGAGVYNLLRWPEPSSFMGPGSPGG